MGATKETGKVVVTQRMDESKMEENRVTEKGTCDCSDGGQGQASRGCGKGDGGNGRGGN